MSKTHLTYRIGRELTAILDRRRGKHSRAVQAKADLLRFYGLLDKELKHTGLTSDELATLAGAYRGGGLDDPADRLRLLIFTLRSLGRDHPLVARLWSLTPTQQRAVVEEIARRQTS